GMATEMLRHACQAAFKIIIIAVQVGDDVARRSPQAFVDSVRLAAILLAHPVCKAILKFPDDVNAPIRASAVDYDVFEIRVALTKYRRNRLFQIIGLVE